MEIDILQLILIITSSTAGAFSLWGWMFTVKARSSHTGVGDWESFAGTLFVPTLYVLSTFIFVFSILLLADPLSVAAYEGVGLQISISQSDIYEATLVPILLLVGVFIGGLWMYTRKEIGQRTFEWFYFTSFVLLLMYAFSPIFAELSTDALYLSVHRFIPFLTLGTAVTGGVLLVGARDSVMSKPVVLSTLYKFMLLGIVIEFVKSLVVVDSSLVVDARFVVMQIILALILLTCVFFVGPWLKVVGRGDGDLAKEYEHIVGPMLIISWLTLVILDSLETLPLQSSITFGIYISAVALSWYTIRTFEAKKYVG